MAQKGLYLNGDPVSLPDGITTFAMNVELDDNVLSYVNSKGFTISIPTLKYSFIKYVCELPNGCIIFGSNYTVNNRDAKIYIEYYTETAYGLQLVKSIESEYLLYKGTDSSIMNCNVSCSYTYNYKKELIITFCINKDNNIYIININDIDDIKASNKNYIDTCILVPDIIYPYINTTSVVGSLYPGVYQFAIQFKYDTGEYTDFSPLTPVISIHNTSAVGLDNVTLRGVELSFKNNDIKYNTARIAILHVGAEDTKAYITKDIAISTDINIVNKYKVSNIDNYSIIPIESILVKTIPVIGAEDCSVNNNKLLLANIKVNNIDNFVIDRIKSLLGYITFSVSNTDLNDNIFTRGEAYVFYLGVIDIKGKIVTSIPIPITQQPGFKVIDTYGLIPDTVSSIYHRSGCGIKCNLNSFINNVGYKDVIGGFVILFAEHTESNSIVLSEGYAIRDGYSTKDNKYVDQFLSRDTFRIYPYDQLYNIRSTIDCKIQPIVNATANNNHFNLTRGFPEPAREGNPFGAELGIALWNNGFHGNIDLQLGAMLNNAPSSPTTIQYISPLNEPENNIQGDSFFRYKSDGTLPTPAPLPANWDERKNPFPYDTSTFGKEAEAQAFTRNRIYIVRLINPNIQTLDVLYGDLTSQKLTIASSIVAIQTPSINANIELIGDSFRGFYAIRAKSPCHHFSISNIESNDDPDSVDSKTGNTNQIVMHGYIISKFNINARFQEDSNIANIVLKSADGDKMKEWSNAGYQYDTNFGHTKGDIYNKCFNENGIEYYPIRTPLDLNKINIITNRIIRSDVISTESTTLGWRYFRPTSYSDIDSTKGEIISIKSSDKKLYIQCQYGLKVNSVKDVIDINKAESTYLGTGDLFDRQSVELIYSPIGYIECESKRHCYYSVFGYIVFDMFNGKIFVINDDGIKCITDGYVGEWFRLMGTKSAISIGVDQSNKILYFTANDGNNNYTNYDNITDQFSTYTIGYNFITNSWISFYSWIPMYSFATSKFYTIIPSNGLLSIAQQTTQRGVYGFDRHGSVIDYILCKSVIKTLFSQPTKGSQLLKSIIWDTKHYNNGNINETKTFNRILIHTANQCSQLLNIDLIKNKSNWWDSTKGSNQKDMYEFNAFNDCMKDRMTLPVGNLLTGYVVKPDVLDPNKLWFNKAAFINMYFFVSLEYDNVHINNKFVINTIQPILISNYR